MDELIKEEEEELRRENFLESDDDDYEEEVEGEEEEEEEEDEEYWDEVEEDDELHFEEEYEEEEVIVEERVKEKSTAKHNKKVSFANQSSAREIRSPADIYAHMLKKAKQSEQSTDVEKITPEDIDFISPLNKPEERKRPTSLFKSGRRSNLLYTPQETRKPTPSTVPIGSVKENIATKNSQRITNSPVKATVMENEVRSEDVDVEALEDEIWMKEVI